MAKLGKQPSRGAPIIKHEIPADPPPFASYEARYLEDIQNHCGKIFEQECQVLHEIFSLTVHVDVLVYKPTQDVPYLTLVTSGMSDLNMQVPPDIESPEDYELAELVAFLPPDWRLPEYDFQEAEGEGRDDQAEEWSHFPVERIKQYARLAHELKTMFAVGQTIGDDTGEPMVTGSKHSGFLFAPALQFGDAMTITTHDGRRINLLNLVSLNPDELSYAITKDGWKLMDKLDAVENFVFDPLRESCLKRKKFFGLF